jgi:hypothetical protein
MQILLPTVRKNANKSQVLFPYSLSPYGEVAGFGRRKAWALLLRQRFLSWFVSWSGYIIEEM